MKESTIMKIHYGTALASVGLVAVHILMRLTTGFSDSLSYENVLANYLSVPYVKMPIANCNKINSLVIIFSW